MASATGIPDQVIAPPVEELVGEDEPLLGRPGDASQKEGRPLYQNLVIGKFVKRRNNRSNFLTRIQVQASSPRPESSC